MATNLVVPTPAQTQPSAADIIGAAGGLPGYGLGWSPQAMQQVNNAVRSGPVTPFGPTPANAKLLKPQNVSIVGPGNNTAVPSTPIYKYAGADGVPTYTDVKPVVSAPIVAPPIAQPIAAPTVTKVPGTPAPITNAPNNGQGVGVNPGLLGGLMRGLDAAGHGIASDYYGAKQALGQTLGLGIDPNEARQAAQAQQSQADAINSQIHNESGVGSYLGRGAQIAGSLAPNAAAFVGAQFIPGVDVGVDASLLARAAPLLGRLGIAGLAGAGQGVSEQDVSQPNTPLTGGDLVKGLAGGALQSAANEALPGLGGKAIEGGFGQALAEGGYKGLAGALARKALVGAKEGAIAGGIGSVGANLARNENLLNNLPGSLAAGAAFGGIASPLLHGVFGRSPAVPENLPPPGPEVTGEQPGVAAPGAAPAQTIQDLLGGKGLNTPETTQPAAAFGMNDNAPPGEVVMVNGVPHLIGGRPNPLDPAAYLKPTAPFIGNTEVTGSNDLALFRQLQAQADREQAVRGLDVTGSNELAPSAAALEPAPGTKGLEVTGTNDLVPGDSIPGETAPGTQGIEVNGFDSSPEGQIKAWAAANGIKDFTDKETAVLPALGKSKTSKAALTKLNSGSNKGDADLDRLRGVLTQMREATPQESTLPKF